VGKGFTKDQNQQQSNRMEYRQDGRGGFKRSKRDVEGDHDGKNHLVRKEHHTGAGRGSKQIERGANGSGRSEWEDIEGMCQIEMMVQPDNKGIENDFRVLKNRNRSKKIIQGQR
jgi:hypothetical protein